MSILGCDAHVAKSSDDHPDANGWSIDRGYHWPVKSIKLWKLGINEAIALFSPFAVHADEVVEIGAAAPRACGVLRCQYEYPHVCVTRDEIGQAAQIFIHRKSTSHLQVVDQVRPRPHRLS